LNIVRQSFVASVVVASVSAGTVSAQSPTSELESVDIRGVRESNSLQLDSSGAQAGTRLDLSLMDTPGSVEVLTSEQMEERGSRTLTDALRTAAGVGGGNPPSAPTSVSMRGFTSLLYLYDGVRTSGAGAVNRIEDTWNYERIELLKGAASVLYGDTAIGGTINFVTKRPDRERASREVMLSYGSHDSFRAAAGWGDALGEGAAFRIDYVHSENNIGVVPNAGERLDHLTAGITFDVGPQTQLDFSLGYLHDDNQGYFGTPVVPSAFAIVPTSVVSTADGRVIDRRIVRENYNVANDKNGSTTYSAKAGLTHQLSSGWTLANELSYNDADRTFRNSESAVFSAPNFIRRDQTLITHDQRYLFDRASASSRESLFGLQNRFVIGAEYGNTSFGSERRFSDGTAATAALLRVPALSPPVTYYDFSPALSAGGGNRVDTDSDVRNVAGFVEDSLTVAKPLTLVLGLRHDRIDVDRELRDLNLGSMIRFSTDYESTSYRAGAVFELNQGSNLYVQYTNATIPVSDLFLLSGGSAPFPLSKGHQIEVGWKQSLSAARLEWTAALYRISLDNVLSRDPSNPNLTVNNGEQSSRGVEVSIAWRPVERFSISGNVAALRAEFDTLIEAGGISRVGNRPPNVPEQVVNLFATYRFESVPLELHVGGNRTGSIYTNTANTIRVDGFTTADAAVTYRSGSGLFALRVRNLTDKLYATFGGRDAGQVLIAPLRTVELSARVSL
jgi:iron complex outermembrane receptor protein